MKVAFVSTLLLALLSACGHKENKEYTYQFTVNTCDTGEHKTDSKDRFCSMLKDEGLNKGCAGDERKQSYEEQSCGSWNG